MNTKFVKNILLGLSLLIFAGSLQAESDLTVGMWDMTMTTPVGDMPFVLTVMENGNGSMVGNGFSNPISEIIVEGNTLVFSATLSIQGQVIPLAFTGLVSSETLNGEFGSTFGAIPVTGMRQ